ncbi:hypothetical protein BH09ACT12_BH09ACT12_09850 [soil metagenome]
MAGFPVFAASPAGAESTRVVSARPIANDDSYDVYASGAYLLDVLANDDTSFLSSGDLSLCGVSVDDANSTVLYAEIDRTDPTKVYFETNRVAQGVFSFTYDACQGDQRDTSTVTVAVDRLITPTVGKRENRRGQLSATNPNSDDLQILWGSNRTNAVDGERRIRSGRTVKIKVERRRVYWVAYLRDQGAVVVAGEGTVKKIRKPKN